MLGRASFLQPVNRERLIVVAIATIVATMALSVGLSALVPSSAHASGCTDSWTNTAGGSWFTGSNWSKSAPDLRRRSVHHRQRHIHRRHDPDRAAR